MKNDANIRNFIEYLGNLHGKSWKICGKSFHFFPFHSTSLHFHSSTPRFSSPNVKSYYT